MSRFGDLVRGKAAAPAPQPVVEEAPVVEEETEVKVALEELSKDELEVYGRSKGLELDKRRSKAKMIEELVELEESEEE